MIWQEIKSNINVTALVEDLEYIESIATYEKSQLCLQYGKEKSWTEGVPTYYHKKEIENEADYINWHEELDNTYIKKLLTSFDFPVSHARIMKIPERACYTTHVDYYTRYHIPIISNPLKSFMIFPDKDVILRMYPGKAYWTNTHELHNFLNGDLQPRIHIVFNNADEPKNLDNPYLRM
jgi:hypothetical protein